MIQGNASPGLIVNILRPEVGRKVQVTACIPVCQPDADRWLTQLLDNLSQFPLGVSWYCDNLDHDTLGRIYDHPQTVGYADYQGPDPYSERCRNHPYWIARDCGARWMLRMDADETLVSHDWPMAEYHMAQTPLQVYKYRWYNVWQHALPQPLIRVDPPFRPQDNYRVVLHPLQGFGWDWKRPAVASAYCDREVKEVQTDLRILHWGFSTPELRRFHKDRWDKLYALGGRPNPYGMWNAACAEGSAWMHPWLPGVSHYDWVDGLDRALRNCPAHYRDLLAKEPHDRVRLSGP
jgi:hypothetical protein